MMDYVNHHLPAFWMTLGLVLLAVEILVMGFTTMVLIFAGLGAIATGGMMYLGVLPETWSAGLASFGIASGVIGVLLWKPFRRMQEGSPGARGSSSDIIGMEFVLGSEVTLTFPGSYRYSGIDWRVELHVSAEVDELAAGSRVRVVSVDVGVLRVVPATQ